MRTLVAVVVFLGLSACAPSATPRPPAVPSGPLVHAQPQIITPTDGATERELFDRAERAMLAQRWREAIDALELLLAAEPADPNLVATATLNLGLAYQGAGDFPKARAMFEKRMAQGEANKSEARVARNRLSAVLAYLEDWPALGKLAEQTLAKSGDLEPMDKLIALGGRALARVAAGEVDAASRDVQSGLDVVEEQHYGTGGRLPAPAAQIQFAQGEVRRARAEKISFLPVSTEFLGKMNARCQLLLDAQGSYADAMRSEDPFWATISGFRVGQMYRALHRDLMSIPPTDFSKGVPNENVTEKQRQIFFGIMHVRYRVLLEKGMEMMKRTYDFALKNQDAGWVLRATQAKKEMELALDEEKAAIAALPFTEQDLEGALKLMEQHYLEKQAKKKSP